MKFIGLTAVILLVLVIKDGLSVCPQSGCECGEFCVDSSNRWCNSNNDKECSCKKGCLVYDQMMMRGDKKEIYGVLCSCKGTATDGNEVCFGDTFSPPDNLTLYVDYPLPSKESPNCKEPVQVHGSYDYDYDFTTDSTDPQ